MTDLGDRQFRAPIDDETSARLGEQGLDVRLVASDDAERFAPWYQALARGFLDSEPSEKQVESASRRMGRRRLVGVFDAGAPDPDRPVATFVSWVAELSVPGGVGIPSCAVSAVSVAPTHRRRGILRSVMAGELRLARDAGVPVAVLTVSESTIYGRFGFASAALSAHARIDVPRAQWTGPRPAGRVDFVSRERFREIAPDLHDRVRLSHPGELEMPDGHWDRFAGTEADAENPEKLRAVQYTDEHGAVQGVALYRAEENHQDFARSKVSVHRLVAVTPDAYAGLWRFLLELDLIGELSAGELAVDEPVLWMIADRRAAKVTVQDHQYVRILDVPAALAARRYAVPGVVTLEVTDPLGFAEGVWTVRVGGDGRASVEPSEAGAQPEGPRVRLGVTELSAAYLGSVSLATLAAAGRVETSDPVTAAALFAWPQQARLSFWY
ncbi:GNAT family N-acetyltransferase [Microbacterium sp. NPDC019599]|uniref:GNAT family N-acetyltransferase n=1 Tax=Microbacterium sp. NPDC019599 TaxID=3154690 RepID=UPI0033D0B8BC